MISQVRDAATTDDMYTILHNFDSTALYNFQHDGMVNMIGSFIGIFLSGIAVTLGISSVLLVVAKREQGFSRRDYFMCAYIILLLSTLLGLETQFFVVSNASTMFFFRPHKIRVQYNATLTKVLYMTLAVLTALADGLLVLRCFLVQAALSHGRLKWTHLFWIFPTCLWIVTVVSTTVVALTTSAHSVPLGISALASNIALNIYATLFITTRLLLHRRMIVTRIGDKVLATQHIYIVSILLESAAINIPITIVAVIWFESLKGITFPVAAASQVLAAALIVYRTALGRVFNQQKEIEIRQLVETREDNVFASVGSILST